MKFFRFTAKVRILKACYISCLNSFIIIPYKKLIILLYNLPIEIRRKA